MNNSWIIDGNSCQAQRKDSPTTSNQPNNNCQQIISKKTIHDKISEHLR